MSLWYVLGAKLLYERICHSVIHSVTKLLTNIFFVRLTSFKITFSELTLQNSNCLWAVMFCLGLVCIECRLSFKRKHLLVCLISFKIMVIEFSLFYKNVSMLNLFKFPAFSNSVILSHRRNSCDKDIINNSFNFVK